MNTYILNGDLPRRRLQYGKDTKDAYAAMTDDGLQAELNKLLVDISTIKKQLDAADEQYLKNRIVADEVWYERAERALAYKNKQLGYVQKKLKDRRRQAHAANLELAKARAEIKGFRATMEERTFVKVCAERLDKILYMEIWEEVKSRMNDFKEDENA